MTSDNNGNGNGGRRWYEKWSAEHVKVVAASLVLGTLILVTPFITTLFAKTATNREALIKYKLEVREKYVTYDEYCRTTDKIWLKLDMIHRDLENLEHISHSVMMEDGE